eukprot:CAMPEP_0172453972 /NCGR_PEP_ID=MMETSP1065-20121228/11095_1 /TAXON_ID=265537 /ORGANISM="Amphiprora paludosa, Strain CCMP125" /LENGTH=295 /DNA_ID=CAMNT_0013206223 /DNA_START=1 /DNA_END=888 /DNA_ORIENTATION=+
MQNQSEREFSHKVRSLPVAVHGKLLNPKGLQTGYMLPVLLHYEFLRIYMHATKGDALLFRRSHIIELTTDPVNDDKKGAVPYAHGAMFQYKRTHIPFSETLTLYSGGGVDDNLPKEVIAFCEKKHHYFTIYGTYPLMEYGGSGADAKMQSVAVLNPKDNSVKSSAVAAFYPWFRVSRGQRTEGGRLCFVHVVATVDEEAVASGVTSPDGQGKVDFEPLFKVEVCDHKHSTNNGSTKSKPTRTTTTFLHEYDHPDSRVAVLQKSVSDDEQDRLQVMVAPGVDPTMTLCIAACMEHM